MPQKRQTPPKAAPPRHKAARPSRARDVPADRRRGPARAPTHRVVACPPGQTPDFHGGKLVPLKPSKPAKRRKDKTLPAGPADTEALIVESLADPAHRVLTVGQRCELIGISRRTWYRHLEDPLFRARASRAYRDCCNDELSGVLNALIQSAKLLGRDGHQDRKLFLELLGEYSPDGSGSSGTVDGKPGHRMSDDELLAAFDGLPHLLPVGVLRRMGKDPDVNEEQERSKAA